MCVNKNLRIWSWLFLICSKISWCTHGILPVYWIPPGVLMISPWCTEHPHCTHDIPHTHHGRPPAYSWYPSSVLNILQCTHDISHTPHGEPLAYSWYPPVYWTPPGVLNTPLYSWYPPVYWTSHNVLMISPTNLIVFPHCTYDISQCTEHPLVYCTPPGVLHRHFAGWQLQTWTYKNGMRIIVDVKEENFNEKKIYFLKEKGWSDAAVTAENLTYLLRMQVLQINCFWWEIARN